MKSTKIEILDTTLRDGEQMSGVHYSPQEKMLIGQCLLKEVGVDRLEYCSALVSEEEKKGLKNFMKWANENALEEKIEVLCFLNKRSIEWIVDAGCHVANLLAKGSLLHIQKQLKQTPEEHLTLILETIDLAKEHGLRCNIYFEDASRGWLDNPELIFSFADQIKTKVEHIMFPDTLGVLCPSQISTLQPFASKYRADFHAHNDYGLATANSLAAVRIGFCGIHATVNGMGERAGNAALEEIVVAIHDFTDKKTNINEKALKKVSELVEKLSGKRVPSNKPIVGENVFTQTAGIHADGDKKGNLYVSKLMAERFGRRRVYALGKLSGKASVEMAIKRLGIDLNENERKEVVRRVVALSEKKEKLTDADLLFIVSDVIRGGRRKFFEIKEFQGVSLLDGKAGAMFKVKIGNEVVERASRGVGIFDAFMNGLRQLAKEKGFVVPNVKDYYVGIPKGGRSDALVEVVVEWENGDTFKTIGVDQDQVVASIKAIEKAINFVNFIERRINGQS